LHGAITNVTIGPNLQQRQNAGNINAPGVEADAQYRLSEQLALRAAFSLTDAHVDGKAQVPQLTGLRPAQTPRWTVTGGASVKPWDRLTIDVGLRFESARFADDRNILRLGSALTADARISYRLYKGVSAYVAGDNLFNTDVASTESQDGIVSYDAPRMIRFGLSYMH
jgi:outer membrane receptor protein involved in Fe transport